MPVSFFFSRVNTPQMDTSHDRVEWKLVVIDDPHTHKAPSTLPLHTFSLPLPYIDVGLPLPYKQSLYLNIVSCDFKCCKAILSFSEAPYSECTFS